MIKLDDGKFFFERLYTGEEKTSRVHYLAYVGDSGYEVNKYRDWLGILCVFGDGVILPTKIRGDYKDRAKQELLIEAAKELLKILKLYNNE